MNEWIQHCLVFVSTFCNLVSMWSILRTDCLGICSGTRAHVTIEGEGWPLTSQSLCEEFRKWVQNSSKTYDVEADVENGVQLHSEHTPQTCVTKLHNKLELGITMPGIYRGIFLNKSRGFFSPIRMISLRYTCFWILEEKMLVFCHILSPFFMPFVDEVFQVTWKVWIQGVELSTRGSDKGPIRLKLVKQSSAQQPLFFTLECFVCAGTLKKCVSKDQPSLFSVLHFIKRCVCLMWLIFVITNW